MNILFLSYDLEDRFSESATSVTDKLERDHISYKNNKLLFFSWSKKTYCKKINENIETVHQRCPFLYLRPVYDFLSIIYAPFICKRKSFSPDVVIIKDIPFTFASLYFKYFKKSKVIFFVNNLPSGLTRTRKYKNFASIYYFISEFIAKYFLDHVFVINNTTKEYALKMGVKSDKITIFSPNVIIRDRSYIEKSQKGTVRKKYNIGIQQKIILSVGRLEKEKAFNELIDLFSTLDDTFILILVGEGSIREKLQKQADNLGISNRVIFTGNVERNQIWDYYQDADVFVLLSKSEALGLVFWEAMYMGVFTIGSEASGIIESIGEKNERGVVLSRPFVRQSFYESVLFATTDSKKRNEIINNARKYVSERTSHHKDFNENYKNIFK